MSDDVPGDVSYWVSRESTRELLAVRADEIARGGLTARWPLIRAIDQELTRREREKRKGEK